MAEGPATAERGSRSSHTAFLRHCCAAGTGRTSLSEGILPEDAIRTIALFRIILKDKTIKVAAGRESVLKDYQDVIFKAGANGMLIGGYLTVAGRSVNKDLALVRRVKKI